MYLSTKQNLALQRGFVLCFGYFIAILLVVIKNNMHIKGFTFINLLVVIAIAVTATGIFVLVLSSNSSRCKGADAAIKANLANIHSDAQTIYKAKGNYSGLCEDPAIKGKTIATADALGGNVVNAGIAGTKSTVVCHLSSDFRSWAISSALKNNTANSWCVDSLGASKQINSGYLGDGITVCP